MPAAGKEKPATMGGPFRLFTVIASPLYRALIVSLSARMGQAKTEAKPLLPVVLNIPGRRAKRGGAEPHISALRLSFVDAAEVPGDNFITCHEI